ncbi:MAG: TlpA family protein disulfide reductase [Flavobacteriales bacterium]|jgi:hypothetical protein
MNALRILLIALLAGSTTLNAQIGQSFPSISGEILEGGNATLPADYAGKLTLVGMGWTRKSEEALRAWVEPLYDKFVLKRGIFDKEYDVNLCLVAMYIGLKQTAYESTMKDLRETSRKDLFPYILFYKGPLEPYDSKLGLVDKSIPYFFLLDEEGKIMHAFSGAFSETKMEKLEEALNHR